MAATYTVTTQTPTTDIGPNGTVEQAMQVTFRTHPSNVIGRINVPMSVYTRDEVDKIVSAAAQVIEDVQAL